MFSFNPSNKSPNAMLNEMVSGAQKEKVEYEITSEQLSVNSYT